MNRKKKLSEKEIRDINKNRARGIFETAKGAEQFGPHPGYVDTQIRFTIYSPTTQRVENLPDKKIDLLVSDISEVDDAMKIIRKALMLWAEGKMTP